MKGDPTPSAGLGFHALAIAGGVGFIDIIGQVAIVPVVSGAETAIVLSTLAQTWLVNTSTVLFAGTCLTIGLGGVGERRGLWLAGLLNIVLAVVSLTAVVLFLTHADVGIFLRMGSGIGDPGGRSLIRASTSGLSAVAILVGLGLWLVAKSNAGRPDVVG
jgi:hypothetical protein